MRSFSLFFIPAAVLFTVPAVADITTSVSGGVGASGMAAVACSTPDCGQGLLTDSFSFGASNSQPTFSFSRSGKASIGSGVTPDNGYLHYAQVSATLQQNVDLTANHLSTLLKTEAYAFGSGSFNTDAEISATNENTVVFDSTGPFVIHLTADETSFPNGVLTTLPNLYFVFSGPEGLIFDSFFSFYPPLGEQSFDETWLLQPGQYTLAQVDDVVNGFAPGAGGEVDDLASLALDADFTPVVPEPRWGVLFLALLVAAVYARVRPRSVL
jgi:hypothetical protein